MRITYTTGMWTLAIGLGGCAGAASSSPANTPPASPQPAAEASATPAPIASEAAPPKSAAPVDAKPKPAPGTPLARLMREHFKEAEQIRHAVISGNPKDAIQPASALGSAVDIANLPPPWRTAMDRMHSASGRVQNSADLAETAAGTADIGVACGTCHESHGGPKVTVGDPPAVGDSVVSRMGRHAWAMERLWEGLYVPSNAAWKAGAKALQGEPFPSEVLEHGGVYGRSAAKDFQALSAQASLKDTAKDRAALYAGLLSTCAKCHLATGRGGQ
ncbi:MAG TPA: hypothetical protein VFK05_18450 [Polyangiaceae bacterium]|nr:hypothetical protein [Polyangiaceae bacterium]